MQSGQGPEERNLLFFGGWHVGVNFDCGIQRRAADGHRYLYSYNCTSRIDELFDLDSEDAVNLIDSPQYAKVRTELIQALGAALQTDPRWARHYQLECLSGNGSVVSIMRATSSCNICSCVSL